MSKIRGKGRSGKPPLPPPCPYEIGSSASATAILGLVACSLQGLGLLGVVPLRLQGTLVAYVAGLCLLDEHPTACAMADKLGISYDRLTRLTRVAAFSACGVVGLLIGLAQSLGHSGWLIIDDVLLPHRWGKQVAGVYWDYDHAEQKNLRGMRVVLILWTDGYWRLPLDEVWGIGPQHRRLLQTHGIDTAFQLSRADERWARKRLTVMGLRTVLELRGVACFGLEELPPAKMAIGRARQFGGRLTELEELYEPLASYVASAGRELRKQHLVAGALRVSLETSQHEEPVYSNSIFRLLPWPTAHTGELIQWACQALAQIWKPDHLYRRCGVLLTELAPETQQQTSLFAAESYDPRKQTLMRAVDHLNAEWGQGALRHAREGLAQTWHMRQGRHSPHYTTRWEELLVVAA